MQHFKTTINYNYDISKPESITITTTFQNQNQLQMQHFVCHQSQLQIQLHKLDPALIGPGPNSNRREKRPRRGVSLCTSDT